MSIIDRTIWFIETHAGSPLGLDDLAAHAGVSRSHLSRIFPLATGYSLFGYLRARRLSLAARALADGATGILSVALDAGYGSHEAFTRAFRDQFGLTPEELRRRGTLSDIAIIEALPMSDQTTTTLAPPVIERLSALRFAGLAERVDMSSQGGFAALWQRFGPYLGHIPGAVGYAAYGIVASADDTACDYMAGVELKLGADVPDGLTGLQAPARRWARFNHPGHISTLRSTIRAIYDQWLPGSGETQADEVSFIEHYGPDFDPRTGQGTCEIWIGLRD
jgi:AraC family transcriptional regulator